MRVKKAILIALIREVLDNSSREKELLVVTSGGMITGKPVDIKTVVAESPNGIKEDMWDTAHIFRQIFSATVAEDEYCLLLHDVTVSLGGSTERVPNLAVFFDQIVAVSVVAKRRGDVPANHI